MTQLVGCLQIRQQAKGLTAHALDFRVFMRQQAALEAAAAVLLQSGSSSQAATTQLAPGTQLEAAEDTSSHTAAGSDVEAGSSATGQSSADLITADSTAAGAAPQTQDEVFRRLYEAAQASLRRKEAYAKAATAAELAALQGAAPHALPLPPTLHKAGGSRPASPAGSIRKEAFIGEAACTFHPHTNLHLAPRSRPATPRKQVAQLPASPLDLQSAVPGSSTAADAATILGAQQPGASAAALPDAAAADPGHLIGSADSGSITAAEIDAAHELAAAALARLTYIEARHALAGGRVSGDAKAAVAPGVSGHLDWDEFMQRQTNFLQAKEQHAQAARADAIPAGRPELCPTSRKLLQHIQSRSNAASQASRKPSSHPLEELAGAGPLKLAALTRLGHEEETFSPMINRDAHALPARSVQEMSGGDALRHELLLEHARHEAAVKQLQRLTLRPTINRTRGIGPVISMADPGRHLAQVAATQIRREAERIQRQMQKEEAELKACTFKPQTKKLPAYISRMAASHRARKAAGTASDDRGSSQDWM